VGKMKKLKELMFLWGMFSTPVLENNNCPKNYSQYENCSEKNVKSIHLFYSPLSRIIPKVINIIKISVPRMKVIKSNFSRNAICVTISPAKVIWDRTNEVLDKFSRCRLVSFINKNIIAQIKKFVKTSYRVNIEN